MATREQEDRIEQLSLAHGRVHVSGGFTDELVRATVPNGTEYHINEDGWIVKETLNFSVDWLRGLDKSETTR